VVGLGTIKDAFGFGGDADLPTPPLWLAKLM